jgi:hypothetical protein
VTLQRVGIFLIFASALLVLALAPVFTGNIDNRKMSFWRRLPMGAFGSLRTNRAILPVVWDVVDIG